MACDLTFLMASDTALWPLTLLHDLCPFPHFSDLISQLLTFLHDL
jgi:hypothetical protein